MTTYHVGGLNPIHRTKTISEALKLASVDDTIILHKSIDESVTIKNPVTIKGNGNKWTVKPGTLGVSVESPVIFEDINFLVGGRANALVGDSNITASNLTIKIIGPVMAFYPIIFLRKGSHIFENCVLTGLTSDDETQTTFDNCTFYSYYGPHIETSDRSECSMIRGNAIINGGYIWSSTFYDVDINNSIIGKFVRVQDARLHDILLSDDVPDSYKLYIIREKDLRKEPARGPLSNTTNNSYHVYGTGKIHINNYQSDEIDDDTLGFYFVNANISVANTNCSEQRTGHHAVKSSIAFKNTKDQNYWNIDDSSFQVIQSHVNSNAQYKSAIEKLHELVGLNNVKHSIDSLMNTINMGGGKDFSNHMIFAGDPGTGKTTVADIVAQALFEVGAISENKCIKATSDTLIKGYVGQTGENVRKILDQALGGVLFIDEAYQLAVKNGQNTFNDDAISVIIRYMEEHRDNLVVIAAGYSKEMRQFIASNPGLGRRFQWIEFEDYSPEEMFRIFELMRKKSEDEYATDVDPRIIQGLFAKLINLNLSRPDANGRITNGGNGGLVRNVYQKIIVAKNNRYSVRGGDLTICHEDIVKGFEEEFKQTIQKQGGTHEG